MSENSEKQSWAGDLALLKKTLTEVYPSRDKLRQFVALVLEFDTAELKEASLSDEVYHLLVLANSKHGSQGYDMILWRALADVPSHPGIFDLALRRLGVDPGDAQGASRLRVALLRAAFRAVHGSKGVRQLVVDHARRFVQALHITDLVLPTDVLPRSSTWQAAETLGVLADLPARSTLRDCLPLGVFMTWVARRPGAPEGIEDDWAAEIGEGDWKSLSSAAGGVTSTDASGVQTAPPSLMVLVQKGTFDGGYTFQVWLHARGSPQPLPLPAKSASCDSLAGFPLCLTLIRRFALNGLPEGTDDRALRVEFIVPESLLELEPEGFEIELSDEEDDVCPLGELHPLSIRCYPRILAELQRNPEDKWFEAPRKWKRQWQKLRSHAPGDDATAAVVVLRDKEEPRKIRSALREDEIACVVFLVDDATYVNGALRTCLKQGVPVVVWQRRASATCPAPAIKTGEDLLRLPERTLQHRKSGCAVTLVWDDPDRIPPLLNPLGT